MTWPRLHVTRTCNGESYFVHMCIEKVIPAKSYHLARYQKLLSSLVKYFTPQDTKTISLQNNRKFMTGSCFQFYVVFSSSINRSLQYRGRLRLSSNYRHLALLEFSLEACVTSTKMSCTALIVTYEHCRQYDINRVPDSLELTKGLNYTVYS